MTENFKTMLLTYPDFHQQSLELITESRKLHFYERGVPIPLMSQGIWQVCRGTVQLNTLNHTGEETLLGWAKASHFFGLWLTNIDVYQAQALSDVYLQWFSLSEIETTTHLSQTILPQVVSRMRQTETLLAIAGLKRVEDRLIELLKLLNKDFGEPINDAIRLSVRFTHQNLANIINTTRVTITRLLGDFQRQGLISFDGDRHIVIHEKFQRFN